MEDTARAALVQRGLRLNYLTLGYNALEADATQTSLCAYLSVIALAGVGLNAALGWWWADPVAALAMVPIIVKEGLEGLHGDAACADCAGQ
jgi:divalent metal cation (Fe/Co/Zn/Cd) transporter